MLLLRKLYINYLMVNVSKRFFKTVRTHQIQCVDAMMLVPKSNKKYWSCGVGIHVNRIINWHKPRWRATLTAELCDFVTGSSKYQLWTSFAALIARVLQIFTKHWHVSLWRIFLNPICPGLLEHIQDPPQNMMDFNNLYIMRGPKPL